MSSSQLKTLAIILVVLIFGIAALTYSKRLGDGSTGELLFPDLKSQINDISRVTIRKFDETATLGSDSGKWVLAERQDYPIDTGKLRQLLLALADAKKLEEKTSNPDMYGRLGVEDFGEDSQGTEIRIARLDSENSLILGNLAQRSYRYARISGEEKSWLIDRDPTLPSNANGWLLQQIVDIEISRIQSVTITHADGEIIRIEKEHPADRDFDVPEIPDGRELTYASVVDGIAGVLSGLNLQDVAKASEAEKDDNSATTVIETFDGLEFTIESSLRDDNTWIIVHASQSASEQTVESEEESESGPHEAANINERVDGWSYQIQRHKADQLRRRWTDILKAEE